MKIDPNAVKQASKDWEKPTLAFILPFQEDAPSKLIPKDRLSTFKLRTVPSDVDSIKYEFVVPHADDTSTTRQAIRFKTNVEKVITGLAITGYAEQKAIISNCLRGGPLRHFDASLDWQP